MNWVWIITSFALGILIGIYSYRCYLLVFGVWCPQCERNLDDWLDEDDTEEYFGADSIFPKKDNPCEP